MGRLINPYNLAEQVKLNTKKINDNSTDIDELYNLVSTIPDTSGFYTKLQTDELLTLKTEKEKSDTTQVGYINYSTEFSPTLSKINLVNGFGTQLRLLSNSIAINTLNNGELEYFIPQDEADITTKKYVDDNLTLKANQSDIDDINYKIMINTANIASNTDQIDYNGGIMEGIQNEVEVNTNNIAINTEDIIENTTSINTLNELIKQSFETFGSYISPSGSATNETIRPILTEILPLNSEYVNVAVSPEQNLFTNKKDGKIIFTISLSNLTNEGTEVANLGLNIWYNGTILITPSIDIPLGWSGSRTITGGLEVEENSQVYVEYVITGSLSVDAPIQYNIDYNSQSFVANPSSAIINDKIENPNIGINTDLNAISSNTTRIGQNETNIINLQTQITALSNSLNTLMPIGTIIISETQPTYGTWVSLGILGDGQALIGGFSSDGFVKSHNHKWNNYLNYKTMDGGGYWVTVGYNTFDINGNVINQNSDNNVNGTGGDNGNIPAYTEKSGVDKNYAYGLGVGENLQIWKRTA